MNVTTLLKEIPPSTSDRLLNSWGYDLLFEYFTIIQHLPIINSPILELATGTGRMCAILSSMFPSIISGDISLTDLPRVAQRVPKQFLNRLQFLQLDMEHLPFRSHSITSLVCMNTLHEVEHPEKCLQEIIRVMGAEGTAVIGDFNRTGFAVMQKIHEQVYRNDHSEGDITTDEIERILKKSFRSVRTVASPLNITYIASDKR